MYLYKTVYKKKPSVMSHTFKCWNTSLRMYVCIKFIDCSNPQYWETQWLRGLMTLEMVSALVV